MTKEEKIKAVCEKFPSLDATDVAAQSDDVLDALAEAPATANPGAIILEAGAGMTRVD